jgi:tetratricopeptide (TPR) repeat protein
VTRGWGWLLSLPILLAAAAALSPTAQDPSQSQDPFQRGLLALQTEHFEDALNAFTAAETQHPEDPRVHNFRGIALMSMGRLDEAATEYRRATELDNHMESAFRNLGYLEWTAHQNDHARQHLQHALRLDPKDRFAAYYLARLEISDGRPQPAILLFKQFADRKLRWSLLDLALAYLGTGQYREAVLVAESLLQDHSSSTNDQASAQSIIGIAESKLHHDDKGRAAFRAAATLAPAQEEHWLNLTRQEMDQKRVADAIASVQQGLASNPKSYALHLRLGAAYFSAGKYEEAEKSFRELVSAGDPLPTSTIGLAQVLLHTGRAAEAATVLADAEHRLGAQFLIVYFEGLALDHAGNRADALTAFKRALAIDPSSVEAHLGIGKTSLVLGKTDEAISELQQVLKAEPGNLPARRLLSRAYARGGDQANATKYATDTVVTDPEPESNLVGDFIMPDWQEPAAE